MSIETTEQEEPGQPDEQGGVERALARADGSLYRAPSTTDQVRAPADANCCRSCGDEISKHTHEPDEIRRVLGDEFGRVGACPGCTDLETFGSAVSEAEPRTSQVRKQSVDVFYEREEGAL